jgi:hypothetical protein
MSLELIRKVDNILDEVSVPERHTYFQMKHFIVGKECTLQGQIWQVIRELRARRENLEALKEQIDDVDDNIKIVNLDLERKNRLKIEGLGDLDLIEQDIYQNKKERELRALYRSKLSLERKSVYLSQEITYLVGAFETLSKVEAPKPLDDIDAQRQYWNEKFTEELNLRLILGQPLDCDFVKTVMSLDENATVKQQMTAILAKVQDQIVAERNRQKIAQEKIDALGQE